MARAVREELSPASFLNDLTGGAVNVLGGRSRADGCAAGGLGLLQHRIGLQKVLWCSTWIAAYDISPRAIGVITRGHSTSDVDDNRIPCCKNAFSEVIMRVRAVGTGTNDDEIHRRVLSQDEGPKVLGNLGFGTSRLQESRYLRMYRIDRSCGAAQFRNLLVLFARKQISEGGGGENEGRAIKHFLETQHVIGRQA